MTRITLLQGRAEIRDKDGTVTGYYSYVDGDGRVAYVNYVADQYGYRVLSNTGVPSAFVTIEGDDNKSTDSDAQKDFGKVFADFTNRIKVTTMWKLMSVVPYIDVMYGNHK